ncbi:MAG: hypothetical protein ACK5KP_06765 [Paludibacteraceae bacterium]
MNVKKIILPVLLFLPLFQSFAQIEREIIHYVDTTELLVKNGRKMILEEVQKYNFTKTHDIYALLNKKTSERYCDAFSYDEHLLISLLTSDWDSFTQKAKNVKSNKTIRCRFSSQNMRNELYNEVAKNHLIFNERVQSANITREDKAFIGIYLTLFQQNQNEKDYADKLKSFEKKYKRSAYNDFIDTYLPVPMYQKSMAISFGGFGVLPQDKLKNYFSEGIGWGIDLDFCIKKIYASVHMNTATTNLLIPFEANSTDGTYYGFLAGDEFKYVQAGLKGGYFIVRSNRFHVAPYVSGGYTTLTSDVFKSEEGEEDSELKVFNSFYAGAGLHTEFKLFEYNGRKSQPYYNVRHPSSGYLSLKLNAGYNYIIDQKIDVFRGNTAYASLSLVLGVGKF